MNLNPYNKTDYENKHNWTLGENKPKQTQFKPKTNPISEIPKMNVNIFSQMAYENKCNWTLGENKPNQTQFTKRPKMNLNFYSTRDYENISGWTLSENKPNQTQFFTPLFRVLYTLRGPAFCFLSSVHGHQTLAIGFAGFIHVNSTCCLFYHFNGLGYLLQLWYLEYFATLAAVYPSVGGTAVKQPGTATFRALGDNLHRYIPYTKSRILNKEHLSKLTLSQNILPRELVVIHQKFIYCPITFLLTKRYNLIYKEQKSVAEFCEIFLDLDA